VTDQVRVSRVGKARGLAAEDYLRESDVEEGILYVELLNEPVTRDRSGEHRANSARFYNRAKSLLVLVLMLRMGTLSASITIYLRLLVLL
jgi:hypothetical protein